MLMAEKPIGIFDSGIGGLTIAHAVTHLLPSENIIYFGDTAHFPYGDKSTAALQAYSIKICDMLLKESCKLILIACHSASAAAYELVKEHVGPRAIVIDVIEPMIQYIGENYKKCTIGLIGTKQTVHTNIYKKKITELNRKIDLHSLATPLLAPMIENGFKEHLAQDIIYNYLSQPELKNIQALMLACTHYTLIKEYISEFYNPSIDIIDAGKLTATAVQQQLKEQGLLNAQKMLATKNFYISDYTESFANSAKIFFQESISIESYPLWE